MPFDHLGNTNNANAVKKVATTTATLTGRTSNLPIYTVNLSALLPVVGNIVNTVIQSMQVNDDADREQGYRQKLNHDDRDGNLPVAPGNGVVYREYFVTGNKLSMPGFVRLVYDTGNARWYITPTHYDFWIPDRTAAVKLNPQNAVPANTPGRQNPFFLIDTAH